MPYGRGKHLRTCQIPNCTTTFYCKPYEIKNGHAKYCSRSCAGKAGRGPQIPLICAYCSKSFTRSPSYLARSKHGLYFCCRKHKDIAQRLEYGLEKMWPPHFNTATGEHNYRRKALNNLPNNCAICFYDDEPRILEVHHRDKDRTNNDLKNLVILCPNCHTKYHKNIITI